MKKTTLSLVMLVAIIMSSCSLSKDNKTYRSTINGTWELSDVSFQNNSGMFKSVLFNDAEDICFEGSEWFFRANNSTGSYTINSAGNCPAGTRNIRWSVVERENGINQFQFKFIDEKRNDISGGLGYRLDIVSLSESTMQLRSNVTVDGQPVSVVYQFIRKAL